MACSDTIEIVVYLEIKSQCALNVTCLEPSQPSNGHTKRSRDTANDTLEWMVMVDWGIEGGTSKKLGL